MYVNADDVAALKIDKQSLEEEKNGLLEKVSGFNVLLFLLQIACHLIKLAHQEEVIGNLGHGRDVLEKEYKLSLADV